MDNTLCRMHTVCWTVNLMATDMTLDDSAIYPDGTYIQTKLRLKAHGRSTHHHTACTDAHRQQKSLGTEATLTTC
jgi:hypothetical protein